MYKSKIRQSKQRGKNEKCREIEYPDDAQRYAVVERLLGNGRVEVFCEDENSKQGVTMVVRIRGSMRKFKSKVIVETNDLVIVAPWGFEENKGDLIHKYSYEEVNYMMYQGMLPDIIHRKIMKNAGGDFGMGTHVDNEDYVVFANTDRQMDNHGGEEEKDTKKSASKFMHDDDINIDDI
jgi:translation initiation factor 1A